ncbi:MAG: hypothetical protein KME04_05130 [Pleurocapsa minor GSE-CHR-MK-17-07R]|nr:hypothetical protein [Pleurocapsa minor GSE-CHR-MK 17-07R]
MLPPNPQPDANRPDRVEDLGVYEMIWDCKFCGTANLPALTHKFCPMCGAAQDPDTRRFPSDAEKIAVSDYKARGTSKICPACSTPNLGDSEFCLQCGSPLDRAAQARTLGSQVRAQDAAFEAGQQRDIVQERLAEDLAASKPAKKSNPVPIIAAVVIGLLLCGGLIFLLTAQRPASVTVEGHSWERIIFVEQFSRVSDNAWDEQVPADAYSVSCSERQRDTRQVPDGERCEVRRIDNGDGTFREQNECYTVYRDEPVYDNYCRYNVNRWVPSREIVASGSGQSPAPSWPQANLSTGSGLGAERESGRQDRYVVDLTSGDSDYSCEVSEAAWLAAGIERTYEIEVGRFTNNVDCSALES